MKYTHTIINNAVTNPFIKLVNDNFNPFEHRFYVIRGWSQSLLSTSRSNNVYLINKISDIINGFRLIFDMMSSRKIFIHGLFTPYLVAIFFFQPWLLKKCYWLVWGGDLYSFQEEHLTLSSKLIEFMRSKIIPNFGVIVTSVDGDYNLAQKWYNVKGRQENVFYPFGLSTKQIDSLILNTEKFAISEYSTKNILIGNSASDTNKHYEIIDYLSKFRNQNLKINASLAYGDKLYGIKVCEKGKNVFGEKFICITEYLPYEDYISLISQMDILIFNHERQQSLGNIFLGIYLKKKVYINSSSSLWNLFKDNLKLTLEATDQIKIEKYSDFISINEIILNENKNKLKEILDEKYVIDKWKLIFDR